MERTVGGCEGWKGEFLCLWNHTMNNKKKKKNNCLNVCIFTTGRIMLNERNMNTKRNQVSFAF